MMRNVTLLITAPFALFVVLFAISNMGSVTARLLPFERDFTMPLYVLCLGMLGAGFLSGASFIWILTRATHFQHWRQKRYMGKLEKELTTLKENGGADIVPTPKV